MCENMHITEAMPYDTDFHKSSCAAAPPALRVYVALCVIAGLRAATRIEQGILSTPNSMIHRIHNQ